MPITTNNASLGGMLESWQKLAARVDALTVRERTIIFVLAAVVLLVTVNGFLLDPLFAKQKRLSNEVSIGQMQIDSLQNEMREIVRRKDDPDAGRREQLKSLVDQKSQMQARLADMQKALVPPEKMTVMLEDILKRHGSLRLMSLKTLPVTSKRPGDAKTRESGAEAANGKRADSSTAAAGAESESAEGTVYSHGVEIVVQGGYLEMLNYMNELEQMPWHVFWGNATLKVDEYPQATLTLTLYTMSLNRKWLNL